MGRIEKTVFISYRREDSAAHAGRRNANGRTEGRGRAGRSHDLAAAAHSSSTTWVFGAMTCLPR